MFHTPLIHINTRFEALHCWPEAPDEVEFLRTPHRHEFHVRVETSVTHDDRELEFILLKRLVDEFLEMHYDLGTTSCEQIARAIIEHLRDIHGNARLYRVTVSEDGENGASVTWTPDGVPT